jgi:hypothetical protein
MNKTIGAIAALALVLAGLAMSQAPITVGNTYVVTDRVLVHKNELTGTLLEIVDQSGDARLLRVRFESPTSPTAGFAPRAPTTATLHVRTPLGVSAFPFQQVNGALVLPVRLHWWATMMVQGVRIVATDAAGIVYDSREITL